MAAPTRRAGIADALALTSEHAAHLRLGRRTQTVTPRQLEDSLAALTETLENASPSEEALAAQLPELAREAAIMVDIAKAIALERSDGSGSNLLYWSRASLAAIEAHRADCGSSAATAASRQARLLVLESAFRAMAMAMEFGFLFDPERQLLSIGFLISESALDPNCYDLLASEARLASFFAIAKGDIPARHWFRLGRAATPVDRGAALISWSGSMFEYLMPPLVMRAPARSLLEQTDRLVVRRQIEYGDELGLPWGISESAYNARDLELTYQYSNFGVPGLGLKRGLGENRVIAPYATGLATMVDPSAAAANFERLATLGARGRYGFYEAVDFTPTRVPEGERFALVRAFMAHHQGMTIVAIANAVFDGAMRERFHAEPIIQATELLLQERVPREVASTRPWAAEVKSGARASDADPSGGRRIVSAHQSDAGDAAAFQRTLRHDADRGRLRIQPLGRPRRHAMAGRRHARRLRLLYLSSGHAERRRLVGRLSADAAPSPTNTPSTSMRIAPSSPRRDGALTTTLGRACFGRGRRRGSARLHLQCGKPHARYRDHLLRRTCSGATRRRCRASGLRQAVRRDRISPGRRRHPCDAAKADPVGARNLGGASERRRWRSGRQAGVRNRPGALPRPRPWRSRADRGDGRRPLTEFGRRRARSDLRVAPACSRRAGRDGSRRLLDDGRGIARGAARSASTSIGTPRPMSARRRWPGPRRRCSSTISASTRAKPGCFNDSQAMSSTRAATCAPRRMPSGKAPARNRACGRRAFRAICRSCCCESPTSKHLDVARQVLQAHEYWRMKQLAVDLVILNERKSSYVQDLQIAIETLVRASQSRPLPESIAGRAGSSSFGRT